MGLRSIFGVFVASILSFAFVPQATGAIIIADTVIDILTRALGRWPVPMEGRFRELSRFQCR